MRTQGLRAPRNGFALFAVIVVVAILALAGTIVAPSLASSNARKRAQTGWDELKLYNPAGLKFRALYSGTVRSPGRLSALTAPIIRPAGTPCPGVYCELNTCGAQTFAAADVAAWNSGTSSFGPFLTHRLIEKNVGYPLPGGLGFVSDTLYRATTPPTAITTAGSAVWVNISAVESADALELDVIADAGNGSATGTVRWGTATGGRVVVYYQVAPPTSATGSWAGC